MRHRIATMLTKLSAHATIIFVIMILAMFRANSAGGWIRRAITLFATNTTGEVYFFAHLPYTCLKKWKLATK